MLITSRGTRRWIVPKGWAEKSLKPHELAAKEAQEEAGIEGDVETAVFGTYIYNKTVQGKKRPKIIPCKVDVFLLKVSFQKDFWKEKDQRDFRWFSPLEAAGLLEAGLAEIVLKLCEDQDAP